MAVQDDHMIRNIQDVGRLIAKLLLHEQQPKLQTSGRRKQITQRQTGFCYNNETGRRRQDQ